MPSFPPTEGIEMKDRRVQIIVLLLNLLAAMAPSWPPHL